MDWLMFYLGCVVGAAGVTIGLMGAAIFDAAVSGPIEGDSSDLWDSFDKDGTYRG